MSDVAIRATATASVPRDYTIPGAQEILPKSVSADMDGTLAASAWYPCLQVLDPGGAVMFSAVSATTVAAGGSANVSWFPRVNGGTSSAGISIVGARIYNSGTLSVLHNTATDVTFDSIDFDTAGMANLGSNSRILTCTVAGYYSVNAQVDYLENVYGRRSIALMLNGYYSVLSGTFVGSMLLPVMAQGDIPLTATAVVHLSPGDFLSVGTRQTSGGTLDTTGTLPANIYSHQLSAVMIAS